MADISKVQVGETQYDIKDETARGKVAGHVIKNASGTAVTQRANMQFKTAAVTDENGETVIRNVVQVTQEQYDALPESKNSDGIIYDITDATVVPAVVETVPIAQGGTGATTAAGARTNLGLGTAATKDSTTSVTDGGTGLPTSGAVYSAIDDVRTDLSDYHVTPSKNRAIPNGTRRTLSSVTYTEEENGVIDANGTATGGNSFYYISERLEWPNEEMVLSGCPSGGDASTYRLIIASSEDSGATVYASDTGSGVIVPANTGGSTLTLDIYIRVAQNASVSHKKFSPMLCSKVAYDADPAYAPYYPAMRDGMFPRSEQAVLGAKNRLNNTATTSTVQGCTFTINANKSVTMNRPTATASNADLTLSEDYLEQGTQLKLSAKGMPDSTTAKLVFFYASDYTVLNVAVANDDELFITIPRSGYYRSYIRVVANKTVSNVTVYPMLRLASDPDDTYVPFAMTNAELTEAAIVEDITSECTFASDITFVTGVSKILKCGKTIFGWLQFTTPSTVSENKMVVQLPAKYTAFYSTMILTPLSKAWSGEHCGFINLLNGTKIALASTNWQTGQTVVCSFTYFLK